MPRDGTQIYVLPFPDVVSDTTIESPVYNGFTNDVAQDLNAPRPIIAGGTGATSAEEALDNLGAEVAMQQVTNYNSHLFVTGSFYSTTLATGAPVANHAFSGSAYVTDEASITVEARDATDGKLYIRRKMVGVWSSWELESDLSGINANIDAIGAAVLVLSAVKLNKAGDTMTGDLVLAANPDQPLEAATKQYVDTQVATAVDPAELTSAINSEVARADAAYQAKDLQLFAGIPPVGKGSGSGTVLSDSQKMLLASGNITIQGTTHPAGTCLSFFASGGALTIGNTETMYYNLGGSALTGARVLSNVGVATAVKITSSEWVISGNGLT